MRENVPSPCRRMNAEERYKARQAELAGLDGPRARIARLQEWLADRLEQHEVFGDEVGTATDYFYLRLCQEMLTALTSHLDHCLIIEYEE